MIIQLKAFAVGTTLMLNSSYVIEEGEEIGLSLTKELLAALWGCMSPVLVISVLAESDKEPMEPAWRHDATGRELVSEKCCEGRPAGHTGECWPLGGVHP